MATNPPQSISPNTFTPLFSTMVPYYNKSFKNIYLSFGQTLHMPYSFKLFSVIVITLKNVSECLLPFGSFHTYFDLVQFIFSFLAFFPSAMEWKQTVF